MPRLSLTLLALFLFPATAAADGVFFWNEGADLREPNQRAVLSRHGGRITMLLEVKYEGPAERFAWVVPVPSVPEVSVLEAEESPFAELSEYTQRREYNGKGPAPDRGEAVQVLERKRAGLYDVAVLDSEDPEALATWLAEQGFALPDRAPATLAPYASAGWIFVALRVDLPADSEAGLRQGDLPPIRLEYRSRKTVFPLRISSLNAGETEVLLYLLDEAPLRLSAVDGMPEEPPPVVSDSHLALGPERVDPRYGVHRRIRASELPKTRAALGLGDEELYLVKFRRVFRPEEMVADLTFTAFEPTAWWSARYRSDAARPALRLRILELLAVSDPGLRPQVEEFRKRVPELTRAWSIREMARLASSEDPGERRRAAGDSRTPPVALLRLARDPEASVRLALARNGAAPSEALRLLARDEDPEVAAAARATAKR